MSDSATPVPLSADRGPVSELGARLRSVRLEAGLSAREVSRQLGVSPSFISQIETGKSLPSVATLYALSQLFGISIDELFELSEEAAEDATEREPVSAGEVPEEPAEAPDEGAAPHTLLAGLARMSTDDATGSPQARVSMVHAGERATLRMASGVVWQRLAVTRDRDINFMEVIYPVGSASTNDNTMLRHEGYEYHYVQHGELKVVVEFDEYLLRPGDSMGFDSSLPHYLANPGDVDTHCIVAVHRCAGGLGS